MTVNSNLVKRYLVLCAGLLIMAFGVAFSIRASLGTSPISSFPYVISIYIPADYHTAKELLTGSAYAASGCNTFWVSDRLCA